MERDPAFGADFHDREKISSILIKRVDAFREGYHQNIGLIGKKFIGKTSILKNFILSLHYADIIPVYVDVSEEAYVDFVRRFMGMLLVGYFQSKGMSLHYETDEMIKIARKELPLTTKDMLRILKLVKAEKIEESFYELFSLVVTLHKETGKKMVLVLDEFARFAQFEIKDPFAIFGKHIMIQKNTMFIVASSQVHEAQIIFNEKLSLLFGNFEIVTVKPFNFKCARNFIRSKLQPYSMAPSLMRFLIRLTDCQPYYLSVLMKRMKLIADRNAVSDISDTLVVKVLEEEVFSLEGKISQHFASQFSAVSAGGKKIFPVSVLVALSFGNKKIKDISRFLEMRVEDVTKILTRLVNDEIVDKNGSFYFLDDPMLCFWLRYVHQLRRVSLKINKSLLNAEFKRRVSELIHFHAEEETQDITRRIENVFLKFKNDTLDIDKKTQKFPVFASIVAIESNSRIHAFIAKSATYRWVCCVGRGKLTEDDVRHCSALCKTEKGAVNKKILVVPYGIDINATLLAREAKMCLWNLRDLNYLLEFYNMSKCVIDTEGIREETIITNAEIARV